MVAAHRRRHRARQHSLYGVARDARSRLAREARVYASQATQPPPCRKRLLINSAGIANDRFFERYWRQYAATVLDIGRSNYLDQRPAVWRQRYRDSARLPEFAAKTAPHRDGTGHGGGAFIATDLRDYCLDTHVAPVRQDCRASRAVIDRRQITFAQRR